MSYQAASLTSTMATVDAAAEAEPEEKKPDDAAVGSISHILKTLFRGLYEEGDVENDESVAEGPAPAPEPDDASLATAMELEAAPWFDSNVVASGGDGEQATRLAARTRARSIARRLERQKTQADDLLTYMTVQTTKAKARDHEEEMNLKRIGLLVNSNIPQHRSSFEFDREATDRIGGTFDDALITAEDLIEGNRKDVAIKSGNYASAGLKVPGPPMLNEEEPSYYKHTATFSKRTSLMLRKSHGPNGEKADPDFVKTFLATDTVQLEKNVKQARRARIATKTSDQEHADATVLYNMTRKGHFLKNPRYDPDYSKKLTVKPASPRALGGVSGLDRRNVYEEKDPFTIAFDANQPPAKTFTKTLAAASSSDLIAVEPACLAFRNHVPSSVYEQTVHIRNTSAISRRLRLLRPSTPFFKVAKVKWPGGEASGTLAPGMSVHALVQFVPDSLADFADQLIVQSESGDVVIELSGRRDPPILDLPATLDVGACLLGGTIRKTFRVTNTGGPGKFRLLNVCDQNVPEHLITYQEVKVDAFVVTPAHFSLATDEFCDVEVIFAPANDHNGAHAAAFLLIDEEQHATSYKLSGRAEGVQVRFAGLNGADFDADQAYRPPSALAFESLALGSSSSHSLELINDGELALDYVMSIEGDAAFAVQVENGDGTLDAKEREVIQVTFAPSEAAYAEATLRVIITQVPRKSAGALPILGEADTVDLEAFACTLRGRGHLARLDIRDGTVAFPRAIYLGERVSGNAITITNPTQSTVAWAFNDAQRITIDGSLVQRADQADLIWAPNGGLLAPGASVASRPTATGMNVGSYDVSCGIDIADEKSGETHEAARVAVVGRVVGMRLKFAEPEVDLGLIAVGGQKVYEINVTNTASVATEVEFLQVEEAVVALVENDDSVGETTMATTIADTFAIDHDCCELSFEPARFVVGPKATGRTLIRCAAGKLPERLRARCTVQTRSAAGGHWAPPQYTSIRGEVQAPKVYLKETSVPLGVVYVGVPVERTLTLVNLSNLATKFKFERPGGASPAFALTFAPQSGELEAKQTLKIVITYAALTAGVVDEVLGCKVFGCALPSGFALRATAKNAVLAYELLAEGQAPPLPLADPSHVQLPDGVDLPLIPPLPPLNFGEDVPLFERRTLRIAVRNLSAIAAPFSLAPQKYAAQKLKQPPPKFKGHIMDGSNNEANAFQSEMGRKHVRKRQIEKEDASYLSQGAGVAFSVAPSSGVLVPWGVLIVEVTAYNNMASYFVDTLSCEVKTAPTAILPISLTIKGCPLAFKAECAGLDLTKEDPVLRFGQVTVGHMKPPEKHVRIRNNGPVDAKVTWRLVREGSENAERQLVATTLEPTEDGCTTTVEWKAPEVYAAPFIVKPASLVIKAHSDGTFTMVLPSQSVTATSHFVEEAGVPGRIASVAVADAEWVSRLQVSDHHDVEEDAPAAKLSSLGSVALVKSMTAKLMKARKEPKILGALKVCLDAQIVAPSLRMEKASKDSQLRFRTWSTVELPPGKLKDAPKSLHRKTLLRNPLDVPVSVSLALDGPFALLRCYSTEFSYVGDDCSEPIKLLPAQSMGVDILFKPPTLPARVSDQPMPLEHLYRGDLSIAFSTGQIQTVALKACVLSPTLVAAPAAHAFGTVRADATSDLVVFLSNPTEVEASWSLTHVPRSQRKSDGIDGDNARPDSVDDPTVFSFEHLAGTVCGPSLPLRSAAACVPKDFNRQAEPLFSQTLTELSWRGTRSLSQSLARDAEANPRAPRPVTVTFAPKRNVRYCSRFRFEVSHGEAFDVVLQGAGSYEEDVLPRSVRVAGRNR